MAINKQEVVETAVDSTEVSAPPMGFSVIVREFKKDKVALGALIILVAILALSAIWSIRLDWERVMEVDILSHFRSPEPFSFDKLIAAWNGEKTYIMGGDEFGRDVFLQIFIATGVSVLIAFAVTTIIAAIGITLGLISGYYGGKVDSAIMRFNDFVMTLPVTMIIIAFLVVVADQSVWTFIFIMSIFSWTGYARIVRSKALSEGRLDYISASKTMSTPTYKIILNEMLPNLSSLITVQLILSYAANIGLETGHFPPI